MRHLMIISVFVFTTVFFVEADTVENKWPAFKESINKKSFDDLPWDVLTFWVNNKELDQKELDAGAESENVSVKAFCNSILLRRGFEKLALKKCKEELGKGNEQFWHVFSKFGGLDTLLSLEFAMKGETDRAKHMQMAKILYQYKASEGARSWLLKNHDLNNDADVLKLASYGLVAEVASQLDRIKHKPNKAGQEAAKYLKMDLAVRKQGGLTKKELKEYKILYTESKKILEGLVKEYDDIKGNKKARALAVDAYRLIMREKKYRETFSKYYKSVEKGEMLLWEIMLDIQENYVVDDRIDPTKLIEAAASGIASALDRHCSYMGVEETRRSEERFSGNYVGLGAIVSKTPLGTVLIESVFFGAPAHKAGIRSGDQVLKVGDLNTSEFTLNENVKMMRGEAGTTVTISVLRKGWDKAVEYVIKREQVNTPTLFVEEMPGGIIYAKLTSFIATSDEDLRNNIAKLRNEMLGRGQDLKGIILDLRDNGGGYLTTAVNICDEFLPKKKLIVYSEGRNQPRQEFFSKHKSLYEGIPLTIIVNKGSASASEVVSGCMRDHKRATIVGERTFGKGSVQNLYDLDSMDGKAKLRMTIAYYYLPNGECVHRKLGNPGGVLPDVVVEPIEESSDTVKELLRLYGDEVFTKYVNKYLAKNMDLMGELAVAGAAASSYPDFEKWFATLKTTLPQERVLKALRLKVRARASEERGKYFLADWHADPYLQAAVKSLAKSGKINLKEIEVYKKIATKK